MEKKLPGGTYSASFIRNSKRLAYLFIALLIGLVQTLEDLAEGDDKIVWSLVHEFVFIVVLLAVLLPVLGWAFRWGWEWWRNKKLLAHWKYTDVLFTALCLFIFPLLLLLLAYPTDFVDEQDDIWVVWVSSLIIVFIIVSIEIFWYMLKKRQQLEAQNERLQRNEEMSKYQALMNQLNPHFLFNSLNVLSYLVYKDQRGAEQFIEELSKMYRYIIQLNETYLVPLKKEMDFIDSYIYLQKIRHRNNLTYESEVDAKSFQKYIPPLTLEVLLENAIKHNVIDAEKPLHIKLSSQNGHLIVENNVQPRNENEVQSTHVGLKNLSEKFYILESEPPEFYIKDGRFIAKIPLLQSEI
ncbi:MAG: sensor histidine kinase [Bacteroidota bacterium]